MATTDSFPSEILSHIFVYCLPYRRPTTISLVGAYDAPYVLTQISRRWRAVAMSTSLLWSDIYLPDIPQDPKVVDYFFLQVSKWIALSQQRPLSFVLRVHGHSPHFSRYAAALHIEIHRWQSATFYVNSNEINEFPTIVPSSMPLLEFFCFDGDYRSSDFVPSLMTSLDSAPRLRGVEIVHPLLHEWALPWHNLSTLNMTHEADSITPDALLEFCRNLSHCAHLTKLWLKIDAYVIADVEPPISRMTLPHVTFFKFTCREADTLLPWFRVLSMPRLKTLILESLPSSFRSDRSWEICSTMCGFLDECRIHSLRSLHLLDICMTDIELIAVLSHVPRLGKLWTEGLHITRYVFNALTLQFHPNGRRITSGRNVCLRHISFLPSIARKGSGILHVRPRLVTRGSGLESENLDDDDEEEEEEEEDNEMDTEEEEEAEVKAEEEEEEAEEEMEEEQNAKHMDEEERKEKTNDGSIDEIVYNKPLPIERGLLKAELEMWDMEVSDPVFCIGMVSMLQSRWYLPRRAKTMGGVKPVQLESFRFVHFDLHILERIDPIGYKKVLRMWKEGLELTVYSSGNRASYAEEHTPMLQLSDDDA